MQLGLGTAALGRPQYINVRTGSSEFTDLDTFKKNGYQVLNAAYDLGIRYFDTAPGYGLAEDLLIHWPKREEDPNLKIGSKWGYTYVANFKVNPLVHEVKEHSLSKLNEQWQVSKQLIPNLNFYQIHSATLDTGVLNNKKVLNKLSELKEKFNINIGITTTGDNQLEVLEKALEVRINGQSLIDTFQCTYNVLDQSVLPMYASIKSSGKTLIIKEALANGRIFRNHNFNHYQELYDYSEELANNYGVGVDAIFLRYCGQTLPDSIVLSGASNVQQLISNLKINSFYLSQNEIDRLNEFKVESKIYWQERKALGWN